MHLQRLPRFGKHIRALSRVTAHRCAGTMAPTVNSARGTPLHFPAKSGKAARGAFSFQLPRESQPENPRNRAAADPNNTPKREIRLDKVTSEDVVSLWPPRPLMQGPVVPEQLELEQRPDLWLREDQVAIEDAGRFVRLPRDDLLELLPEGPCGELARDLTLVPSRSRPVGLMLRKLTIELMRTLTDLRDATCSKGRPRINKAGFLLDGKRGVGKSQIMNLLTIWARRNGWLVVVEPAVSRYRMEIADIKRSNNGVYIQNEFSQQFLEATSIANREMFMNIPVDMSVYGSTGLDGEPLSEAKKLYQPLIETTVDAEVENIEDPTERLKRIAKYAKKVRMPSMVEQLPTPGNVWDIVEFGLENETHATQAVAELFLQLQKQDTYPVLVMCDQWNECFPVSEYVSIRYDNTRFHGYIPAYHLTMPRAFHKWDGYKYKRGLKICATSWVRYKRRDYRPDLLGVKDHEVRTVRAFTQQEFANYVTYLRLMGVLHHFPKKDLEYFYMMTQGNGFQTRKMLSMLY